MKAANQFDAVVGFYFVLIAHVGHVTSQSSTVGNRLSTGMWSLDPNAPGFWKLLGRNFVATSVMFISWWHLYHAPSTAKNGVLIPLEIATW